MNTDEGHQQELEAREQYEKEMLDLMCEVKELQVCFGGEMSDTMAIEMWAAGFENCMKRFEAAQQTYIRSQNHEKDT